MRLMSFALTTEQVRQQRKIVTRRTGWRFLRPGELVQPVVKGQGLKKGESPEKVGGPIRIVSVRREPLNALLNDRLYGLREVVAEGFDEGQQGIQTPQDFIKFFAKTHGCRTDAVVTRIEFEYTEPLV